MNWYKFFTFNQKLDNFCPFEVFFELHIRATEEQKEQTRPTGTGRNGRERKIF